MSEYLPALLGGTLIGLAVCLLMLTQGKIAGISGILWQASQKPRLQNWRWYLLLGLPIGSYLCYQLTDITIPVLPNNDALTLISAGFLVGLGTKLGSGCTSGHGVCGIGRLSYRSIVATTTFISSAMITVWLIGG